MRPPCVALSTLRASGSNAAPAQKFQSRPRWHEATGFETSGPPAHSRAIAFEDEFSGAVAKQIDTPGIIDAETACVV
jgi:hypothetical protein